MNYAEKVWDTINRAWNGDLKAQLSLLCVDVALNGDSRLIEDPRSWSRLSIRRMVNNNDQRKRIYTVCEPMRCKVWNRHELRGVQRGM